MEQVDKHIICNSLVPYSWLMLYFYLYATVLNIAGTIHLNTLVL